MSAHCSPWTERKTTPSRVDRLKQGRGTAEHELHRACHPRLERGCKGHHERREGVEYEEQRGGVASVRSYVRESSQVHLRTIALAEETGRNGCMILENGNDAGISLLLDIPQLPSYYPLLHLLLFLCFNLVP